MHQKALKKIKCLLIVALIFCASMLCFLSFKGRAEDFLVSELSLSLNEEATFFKDDKNNKQGMQFTATVPEDEYELLTSQVNSGAYKGLEYGLVILPKYYTDNFPVNENTLFGATAVYDFAEYIENDWSYTGDKIRVININANDWVYKDGEYIYTGAIVDILDKNLMLEMYAIAYVGVIKSDNTVEYKFSNSTTSSAVYMAQRQIESGNLSLTDVNFLKENYIDKVNEKYTYTTEYYVKTDNGYKLFKTETSSELALGTQVSANVIDYSANGLFVDKDNEFSILSGQVYANDKLTLKVYYTFGDNGLFDLKNTSSIDFGLLSSFVPDATKLRVYRTIGDKEYSFSVDLTKNPIDVSTWDKGTYKFVIETTDGTETIRALSVSFDLYHSDDQVVFTDVEKASTQSWGAAGARHVATRPFVMGWGVDWRLTMAESVPDGASKGNEEYFYTFTERYNNSTTSLTYAVQRLYIRPIHSKVYYERFLDENLILKFEYYLKNDEVEGTRSVAINDGSYSTKQFGVWHQGELSIKKLFDNWDYITAPVSNTTGDVGALLTIKADTKNPINYEIYFGNIRFEDTRIAFDNVERQIDINGNDVYHLLSVVPEKVKPLINSSSIVKYILTDRNGVAFTFDTDEVVFSNALPYGKYTLSINADGKNIYTGKFDFYNSLNYDWNIPNEKDLSVKYTAYSVHSSKILGDKPYEIINADKTTDTNSVLYGKTGNYVKMTSQDSENIVFNLLPIHSMSCYEKLFNKGYVLTFDYYATTNVVGRYVGTADYENSFKTWRGSLYSNKWGEVSISLDNFLLQKDTDYSGYYMRWEKVGLSDDTNDRMFVAEVMGAGELYIGNFRIEQMTDYIAMSSTAKNVNVYGRPYVDLLNSLSDLQREKYDYYVSTYGDASWTIKFIDGTNIKLDAGNTQIPLTDCLDELNQGVASVTATIVTNSPDGVRRLYTIVSLSNLTFMGFPTEVSASISCIDSNTEILQNIDHYETGELVDGSTLSVVAIKNETESAQIIITPNEDVGYYGVELMDLRGGGNYLFASNFSAYHQHYVEVKKSMGKYYPYSTGMYPDALIPMENAIGKEVNTIKSGENQGIWVQFNIPKDQPAGTYTGYFYLYLENSFKTIPVSVTVVDYELTDTYLKNTFGLNKNNVKNLESLSGMTEEEITDFYNQYYYEELSKYGVNLGSFATANEERWAGTYWIGRPYNPDAIFSFDLITVKGKTYYQYEYPLVSLNDNNEFELFWNGAYATGYGYNAVKVSEWVDKALTYAQNDSVNRYQLPVITGASVNYTIDSLATLYPADGRGYGNYTEARRDMPDGYRINSVNLLTTRDVYEQIFLASIENGVDLFKKGDLFYSWIDEYNNNLEKLKVAKIILKIMKDYFPDLAEWLRIKHGVTDEFGLSVIESIKNLQVTSTGENTYDFDPDIQWTAHCPSDGQYQSEKRREEILEWANSVYNGEGQVWTYNGGYKIEDPATTIKSRGWWMYDYDVEADLQWAIMAHQYLDGISDSLVGKDVSDGEVITPEDFYDIAVHYGGMTGIGYMIYPGSPFGVKGFVPSIRLDSYRDSVEDYSLLYELERFYEQRAKDKGLTYDSSDFDSIMDRLTEKMYNGVKYKTHDGYQDDYLTSRATLLNMLVLAKNYGIIVEKCVSVGDTITFYVSAPNNITLSGYKTKSALNGYSIYIYEAGEKYFEFDYNGINLKLSVEVYRETAMLGHLVWTDGENDTYKTYSDKVVNSTSSPIDVELIQLNAAVTVGGVAEGKYYHVKARNSKDYGKHIGFTLFPDYDYDYYAEYADITSLKFDVYFKITDENGNHPDKFRLFYYLGYSQNSQQLANEWFTIEVPMTTVLSHWEKLTSTTNDTEYRVTAGNLFTLLGSHGSTQLEFEYYIGNFRIEHN